MPEIQGLPPRRARQKAPPRKRPRRILRLFLLLLGVVIVTLGWYLGYLYNKAVDNIEKIADPTPSVSSLPPEGLAREKPIGMLVLGLDTRAEIGGMNTDVMMAAVFNPQSKTATVVSIPRDSDLNLPGYKSQKANAFYAGFLSTARSKEKLQGDQARKYATEHMKEMISKFLEVPIDYAIIVDFQGFVDVIDALGGINVYVDQDMRYWDHADGTDINLKKGNQTLNGEEALGFVRYRKSRDNLTRESSDFERNERQDRVLAAILDKLKSLGSVTRIGSLMDAAGNNIKSDMPEVQINNFIRTYFGITPKNVRFIALTGEWRSPFVHLDQEKLAEAKRALQEELQPDGRPVAPVATVEPASAETADSAK